MCCSLLNKIYELWMQFRYHFDARVKTAKKKSLNYASACRGTRLARPKGFEPPIFRIGICCVIQLRHRRVYKGRFSVPVFYFYAS